MKKYWIIIGLLICTVYNSFSQGLNTDSLHNCCNRALSTFKVPGMAVAIVKDGKVIILQGYGVRSIQSPEKVDENTLFGIASNSKAFTAAAIGILADQGKLKLDDKVIDYLPEFRMYDPYVTHEFTIRDLLTHRSGLGLGAGDLMHNPDSSNFTIQDIIRNLRFLKPEASFRSRYAYDNIFYLVAGQLIERVSGLSWNDFIERNIMAPLQMNNSRASYNRAKGFPDIIDGHREVNGKLETIVRTNSEMDAGAGGIYASAADMSKWMLMQLNHGKYGNQQILSEAIHKEMWAPQVIIPVSKPGEYNTHFGAYGLGWFLTDVKGFLEVSHTGQDDGMISEVTLIPELHLGITVLSNQEGGGAVRAIVDLIRDRYLGIAGKDRIQQWSDKVKQQNQSGDIITDSVWAAVTRNAKKWNATIHAVPYLGTYQDNWFGKVQIDVQDGNLWFRSERSPQLRGQMYPYQGNTFVVRWFNPQIQADAFVSFQLDENGMASGMTMKRVSPATSFAYDFQDLEFHRLKN